MSSNLAKGVIDKQLPSPEDAVKELGGLPKLERYVPGSGVPPRFIAGTAEQVHEQITQLSTDLAVDEIMIQDMMTDHNARLHSYDLMASVFGLTSP